jgi:hypothetical protein
MTLGRPSDKLPPMKSAARWLTIPFALATLLILLGPGCKAHPCTEVRCGAGSTACIEEDGAARCVCAPGFTGADCGSCAEGYLSVGGDCVPGCDVAEIDCGAHGTCADSDGSPRCVCDAGYGGEGCDGCLTGWQDNDGDGICRPDCVEAGLSCPDRARCSDESGLAICVCDDGWDLVGDGCVWVSGPGDPYFERDDVWQTEGDAVLDPDGEGHERGGFGLLPGPNACDSSATIHQTFDMPASAGTPPLALTFQARRACAGDSCYDSPRIHVASSGGGRVFDNAADDWLAYRVCVGDGALGAQTGVSFHSRSMSFDCQFFPEQTYDILVDAVGFAPDAVCPAIGEVLDADLSAGLWRPVGTGAEVSDDHGESGAGARLSLANLCSQSRLLGSVSVPLNRTLARPALTVRYRTSGDADTRVNFGDTRRHPDDNDLVWANLPQSDTWTTGTICLPEYPKGKVLPLVFELWGGGGGCGTQLDHVVYLDHFDLVSDDRCPADASVIDGQFDGSVELVPTWRLMSPGEARNAAAEIVWADDAAYVGDAVLRLAVSHRCDAATAEATLTVPESEAGEGPALSYRYRTPSVAFGEASSTPGNGPLPQRTDWAREIVCLDGAPGSPVAVTFRRTGGGGLCADSFATQEMWVDDVQVISTADCAD